jgi:phosphoglycerol transferase MdoB-like AlkP superfamily enzyme
MSRVKINTILFLFLITLYLLIRLIFYFVNWEYFQDISSVEVLTSFLVGIKFDISAILMLNLPVILLFNLPINLLKYKWVRVTLFSIFCFLNILALSLNFADLGYYPTIQKRLSYEPYTLLPDIIGMLPGLINNYFILIFAFILTSVVFIIVTLKLVKLVKDRSAHKFSFVKSVVWFILIVVLMIIGIRGGIQLKPMRLTNAFFSEKKVLGYLTLNTTYTVLRSYFQYTLPEYEFMPKQKADSITVAMVKSENEKSTDTNFIFMRKNIGHDQFVKKNIVIFIMESWSAKFIGSITGEKTFTPFFDSLARNGILFTNFMASGLRSIEAVPSILASIPSVFPQSLIGSRSEISTIRGLGSILLEQNYTTSFHYGARLGSMGFDGYVPSAGFKENFSKNDFTNYADSVDDGTWGIFDEPYFLNTAEKINNFNQPFCSVIFSLTSHDPLKIPAYRKSLFEKFAGESDFEKVLRYSDFSLQQFFALAKSQDWFENTIFIITADHTIYTERNNLFEMFHIPLLIYSPKDIQPRIISDVGTHVDILPTVLDLLKITSTHASMGRSLLDSSTHPFAVEIVGPYYTFFDNQYLYLNNFDNSAELYDYHASNFPQNNSIKENKAKAEEFSLKLKAYIQSVTKAVNEDLIYKNKN